jgi:hypothetical protein
MQIKTLLAKIAHRSLTVLPFGVLLVLGGRAVLTGTYPMPFDESFHFGIINFYAHHINPFFSSQPASTYSLGALSRDPSYLYQYLMSYPLRGLLALHVNMHTQIISLRFINLALAGVTLFLVLRLSRSYRLPKIVGLLSCLALAVTPVFDELSSQINYDNLLIPLTLVTVLLVSRLSHEMQTRQVHVRSIVSVVTVLALTSLVQYSYLPILVASVVYLSFTLIRSHQFKELRQSLLEDARKVSTLKKIAWSSLVIVSCGLWIQRYGINVIRFHTPHPQCNAVLSVQQCMSYAPWARNYNLHAALNGHLAVFGAHYLVHFVHLWLGTMYKELFGFIAVQSGHIVWTSDIFIYKMAEFVSLIVAICLITSGRGLHSFLKTWALPLVISTAYLSALWVQNFSDFHNLGELVAVQGRYLLPILPFAYLASLQLIHSRWRSSWDSLLTNSKSQYVLPVGLSYSVRIRNQFTTSLWTIWRRLPRITISSSNKLISLHVNYSSDQ